MAVDVKYLKENGLYEAYKRFNQINEYSFFEGSSVEEAEPDPAAAGADPNAAAMGGGAADTNAAAGGDPNAMGANPNAAAMGGGAADPNAAAGGIDPNAVDPNMFPQGVDNDGLDGNGVDDETGMGDPNAATEPMQDGDEVIDVDELTNAEEENSAKIDGVDQKIANLADVAEKLIQAIEGENSKLENLKAEIMGELEKRNPTPEEKMDIRLGVAGNPFNGGIKDYFDDQKRNNPNYDVNVDGDKASDQEYEINSDDLGSGAGIENTFEDYPSSLEDYFKK